MIGKRIKELRAEHNLTQANLADNLNIAKTTLAAYEQEKNEPNIRILIKLSKYFNVSVDYLLGITDVKTTKPTIAYISDYLGLTERSIEALHMCNNVVKQNPNSYIKQKQKVFNMFFEPSCEVLEHMTSYLYFSATHFKDFYDDSSDALHPISHLELWDNVEKSSYSDDWDLWSKALLLIVEEDLMHIREKILQERFNMLYPPIQGPSKEPPDEK